MQPQEYRGEELVDEYASLVYKLAFARTRDRDAADDIFQEVFLRYVSRAPVFESKEHEKAWFCRVTDGAPPPRRAAAGRRFALQKNLRGFSKILVVTLHPLMYNQQ